MQTKIRAEQTNTDSATQTLTNKTLTSPKLNENVALTSTSTELNALDGKTGAWTSWTPTWLGITVGNGTNYGYYIQIGKIVHFRAGLIFGSTTSITAYVRLTLPVTISSNYQVYEVIGLARFTDDGTLMNGRIYNTDGFISADTVSGSYLIHSNLSSTVPFTWTTADKIQVEGTYEAA